MVKLTFGKCSPGLNNIDVEVFQNDFEPILEEAERVPQLSLEDSIAIAGLAESLTRVSLTPIIAREIDYMSLGYTHEDRLEQGHSYEAVRSRRKRGRLQLGAKTMRQAVFIAVNEGHIPVLIDQNETYTPLSLSEDAILRLSAMGYTAEAIAKQFKITQKTVDSHYESIRTKLTARNMHHAVRRAFEVGIFEVGQHISFPSEIDNIKNTPIRVKIGEQVVAPSDIGIVHPREVELLAILQNLESGTFIRADIYGFGFYEEAKTPGARASAYGHAIASLSRKINAAFGSPVIEKVQIKARRYAIRQPISIGLAGDMRALPVLDSQKYDELVSHKEETKRKQRSLLRLSEAEPAKTIQSKESKTADSQDTPPKYIGIKVFAD